MAANSTATDHIYEDMNSPREHKENDKALEMDDRSKSGRNQGEIVGSIKWERACSRPRALLILALLTLSILIVSFGAVSVHIYLEYAEIKDQIDKLSTEVTMMQVNKSCLQNERDNVESIQQTIQELPSLVTDYTLSVVSFDSCRAVMQFPHLPCGVYNIRSFDGTHTQSFCKLNCSNPFQGWRRIAYLDINSSHASSCPEGFVSRNNPSACIRKNSSPGCSSVIYHNHNLTTYSKIIGRVHANPYCTLGGFFKFGNDRPQSPTLDQNYVDGVSITLGTPRQHIWTLTFSVNSTQKCRRCFSDKPSFVSNHYSCVEVLGVGCTLLGQRQCVGSGEFFFRDLPHAIKDDFEVRVCRDENRENEDISISLLEIYVQ